MYSWASAPAGSARCSLSTGLAPGSAEGTRPPLLRAPWPRHLSTVPGHWITWLQTWKAPGILGKFGHILLSRGSCRSDGGLFSHQLETWLAVSDEVELEPARHPRPVSHAPHSWGCCPRGTFTSIHRQLLADLNWESPREGSVRRWAPLGRVTHHTHLLWVQFSSIVWCIFTSERCHESPPRTRYSQVRNNRKLAHVLPLPLPCSC